LVAQGLPLSASWRMYLPVMGISFCLMVPAIIVAEKRGKIKSVLLAAIAAVLIGQLCLATFPHTLTWLAVSLLVYFTGFNVLEAAQPSLVSKLAPGARKGAAMGVYNTTQALGLFSGGALGGLVLKYTSQEGVFLACSALVLVWLIIAATMKQPPRPAHASTASARAA